MMRRRPPPRPRLSVRVNNNGAKAISPTLPTHKAIARQGWCPNSTLAVTALVAFCFLLPYWICLRMELRKVGEEDMRNSALARAPSLLRVSSRDRANVTQFFPCVDDVSVPPYTEIESILTPDRKRSRSPGFTSLPCAPPNKNKCFRGVYDGFDDLVSDAFKALVSDSQTDVHGIFRRIAVLLESLILRSEAPPSSELLPKDAEPTVLEAAVEKINPVRRQKTTTLHSDYFETEKFVYSAILYDEPPMDLVGGETALVDFTTDGGHDHTKKYPGGGKVTFGMKIAGNETVVPPEVETPVDFFRNDDRRVEFASGTIVEPKLGRLLLFSAGGENFHAPMEVEGGYRPSYIFWFQCKGSDPTADIR